MSEKQLSKNWVKTFVVDGIFINIFSIHQKYSFSSMTEIKKHLTYFATSRIFKLFEISCFFFSWKLSARQSVSTCIFSFFIDNTMGDSVLTREDNDPKKGTKKTEYYHASGTEKGWLNCSLRKHVERNLISCFASCIFVFHPTLEYA